MTERNLQKLVDGRVWHHFNCPLDQDGNKVEEKVKQQQKQEDKQLEKRYSKQVEEEK